MKRAAAIAVAFTFLMATSPHAEDGADAQSGSSPSSKGRVIGTIVGAAGGFVLGLFAGLNWFDDAIDSDRKVWTTAIAFSAAAGVGGYFIGRAADSPARPATGASPIVPGRRPWPSRWTAAKPEAPLGSRLESVEDDLPRRVRNLNRGQANH